MRKNTEDIIMKRKLNTKTSANKKKYAILLSLMICLS